MHVSYKGYQKMILFLTPDKIFIDSIPNTFVETRISEETKAAFFIADGFCLS